MPGEMQGRVKALLVEGLTNKEIAQRLHISVRAVKEHTSNLHTKYGLYGVGSIRRLIVLLVKEDLGRQ